MLDKSERRTGKSRDTGDLLQTQLGEAIGSHVSVKL